MGEVSLVLDARGNNVEFEKPVAIDNSNYQFPKSESNLG
jgi:hypothetical protein